MAQKVRADRRSASRRGAGNGKLADEPILLDQLIEREDEQHPGLRRAVELGVERRQFLNDLAKLREEHGFSQKEVAVRMGTAQPAVARLESGVIDPRFSTLQKYTEAIGFRIELMNGASPSKSE